MWYCFDDQILRVVGNHWLIYEGEVVKNSSSSASKKPAFCVRRNMSIMKAKASVLAYVYGGPSGKGFKYTIEGSYTRRSCKIMDESGRACSEIKRKKPLKGGASFGLEVFDLIVQPGFDSRFAMAIVLLLDQMFSWPFVFICFKGIYPLWFNERTLVSFQLVCFIILYNITYNIQLIGQLKWTKN